MGKWNYTLQFGKTLRSTIDNGGEDVESCKNTLLALANCYREIKHKLRVDEWEDIEPEFETVQHHIDVLNMNPEDMEDNLIDDGFDGWNRPLECVNDDLRIFYDMCDYMRIWIGI